MNSAINAVFAALMKLALFHGLLTWLTFTVFSINGGIGKYTLTVASALLADLAIVPPVVTVLPGIVELLLLKNYSNAMWLGLSHFVAWWHYDTRIYSEVAIVHPYVTGLSFVGGVFFFGVEGVVLGPMVLCMMQIAKQVYVGRRRAQQALRPPGGATTRRRRTRAGT